MISPNDSTGTGSWPLFRVTTSDANDSKSSNSFNILLNSKFAGLIKWHNERPLVMVSAVNISKYGVAPEQICNRHKGWIDLVVPQDKEILVEHLESFRSGQVGGTQYSSHVIYTIANGGSRHTIGQETFGKYGKDGGLLSLESLIFDLPSSAVGLTEFERENQLIREVVDLIPSWIFIKNAKHQYEFVNSSYAAIYGLPPHACVGKTAIELGADPDCVRGNPERGIEGFWAADDEVFATGKPVRISAEPIVVDGETKYLQTLKMPLGKDRLFGFVHDVSYLKTLENKNALELRDNKVVNSINQVLRSGNQVTDTFHRVSQIVLESLDADKAEIQYSTRDQGRTSVLATRTSEMDGAPAPARHVIRRISVAIEFANRQIGTLTVDRAEGDSKFTDQDEKLLQSIANQIAFKLNQREMAEEIKHRAYHDSLTDLPNRDMLASKFNEALERSTLNEQVCGIACLDLDGFKTINDTLGHHVGDELLLAVARRLRAATVAHDVPARIGGDEFAILLTNLPDKETGTAVARQFINVFKKSFSVLGREIHLRASIGVSFFPEDGQDVSTLLRRADAAMYQAKSSGESSCHVFTQEIAKKASQRLEIEADLRRAIIANQLSLVYQPKIDLTSGKAIGVEALMRWNHPSRGVVSPTTFIPVAEESGYIIELGQWVIREACRAAVRWRNVLGYPMNLAVNVSPLQLDREEFAGEVLEAIVQTGLDPSQLELELTETHLMNKIDQITPRLQVLRDHGIKISIDDFGTGYSCMSYLQNLPVDFLKIDQSFVRLLDSDGGDGNDNQNAIMRTIVHLAQMMGLKTVAEGIETDMQRELSARFGVDLGQGYLFSRPITEQETLDYFKNQQ